MYACMHACMDACMHACMHVWMHVCMYACMHACMWLISTNSSAWKVRPFGNIAHTSHPPNDVAVDSSSPGEDLLWEIARISKFRIFDGNQIGISCKYIYIYFFQALLFNGSCHSILPLLKRGFGSSYCWNLGFEQSERGAQTCRRNWGANMRTPPVWSTTDHGDMEGMYLIVNTNKAEMITYLHYYTGIHIGFYSEMGCLVFIARLVDIRSNMLHGWFIGDNW